MVTLAKADASDSAKEISSVEVGRSWSNPKNSICVTASGRRPALVNPPQSQFGLHRDNVRNGAIRCGARLASDLIEFSRCQNCCCNESCIFQVIH